MWDTGSFGALSMPSRCTPLVTMLTSATTPGTVMRNEEHQKVSNLTTFTGRKPPLSPCAFVTRIGKYSGASPCCFAVGLIYLERMKKRDPGVCLVSTNFQRLFLVAVMIAAKFLDDYYYSNKHWAEVRSLWLKPSCRQHLLTRGGCAGWGHYNAGDQPAGDRVSVSHGLLIAHAT